ncbi:MAG: phosphatase PAP2 family protein [Pseudomonadota bacterium]
MKKTNHIENFLFQPLLLLFLLLLGTAFEYSGLDLWWVSHFYDFPSQNWLFKHHWFFDSVIHTGGQWLVKIMALMWLIAFIMTFFRQSMKPFRKILVYFIVATAAGPLLVNLGKQFTHIYTPWDLQIFHGEQPYIRLFDTVPDGAPVGHAFPAGHSSGGFAFLSLYFLMKHHDSLYSRYGLFFGLCLGLVFGLGQQVRGAHFPSHDLFSLAICWGAGMTVYFAFYPDQWRIFKKC